MLSKTLASSGFPDAQTHIQSMGGGGVSSDTTDQAAFSVLPGSLVGAPEQPPTGTCRSPSSPFSRSPSPRRQSWVPVLWARHTADHRRVPTSRGAWLRDRGLTLGPQDSLQPKRERAHNPSQCQRAGVHVPLGTRSSFYRISKGLCVPWRGHTKECSGLKRGCGGSGEVRGQSSLDSHPGQFPGLPVSQLACLSVPTCSTGYLGCQDRAQVLCCLDVSCLCRNITAHVPGLTRPTCQGELGVWLEPSLWE